jgi:hypothetical protein
MNSIILKELLTNASRHKGEPLPAAIKIIVDYVKEMEAESEEDYRHGIKLAQGNSIEMLRKDKYIGELEARIDELKQGLMS